MRRFGRDEGGQAIVLIATTFLGMLMIVGLAIDAGQLFVARRTMQEAADAGAYAGAVVLYQGGNAAAARDAATADTALNGYTNGGDSGNFTVTVNSPPTSGAFVGNALYVQVIISANVRTALVPAQSTLTQVTVRATAGSEPLNNKYGIMALDRGNTQNALWIRSGGTINISGAGVLSNSTHPTGAAVSNSTNINYNCTLPTVCYTDANGGIEGTWPNPRPSHPQEPDPFSGFPKPNLPACATPPTTTCLYNSMPNGNPVILDPGVYTTDIRMSGNEDVILNPGVYILKNGITISGNGNLISAGLDNPPTCASNCGVFIFNTTTNYPSSGGSCGKIALTGGGQTILAAQTSGTYAGMLLYQDAACTQTMDVSGNGSFTTTGTLYLPNANFVLNGQNATLAGSQVVARTVDIQNGNITINFTAGTTAQPILPRLAE